MPVANLPPISGVLNNCGIGVVLPSIFHKLLQLGRFERATRFSESPNLSEYRQVKSLFCQYYAIADDGFTFKQFADYLDRQTFLALQLIMGPVLRQYIYGQAILKGEYQSESCRFATILAEGMDGVAEAGASLGRYPSLSPVQVNNFLCAPLGIQPIFFVNQARMSIEDMGPQRFQEPAHTEYRIEVHYAHEHYELQSHVPEKPANADDADNNDREFFDFVTRCGEGSSQATEAALNDLKTKVYNEILAHRANNAPPEDNFDEAAPAFELLGFANSGPANVNLTSTAAVPAAPAVVPVTAGVSVSAASDPALAVAPAGPASAAASPAAGPASAELEPVVAAKITRLVGAVQPSHQAEYQKLITDLLTRHQQGFFKSKSTDNEDESIAKELQAKYIDSFIGGGSCP